MKLTQLLKEGKLNEVNPRLNKKVKKFLDDYLRGIKPNSPEFQHAVMVVMRGALTDANFHSEAKKLDSLFPKASQHKVSSQMEDVMEDKGIDIAGWAKWDGHDIIDAFSFYTNMTIGGGFGSKLETLKESISELKEAETLAEDHSSDPNDKYVVRPCKNEDEPWAVWEGEVRVKGFATKEEAQAYADKQNKEQGLGESINEGKFKVDDLVYNKRTKTVGIVRMGDDKYGEVKTDADGNVDVDELEKYNPIKFKHQEKAKVAPSTEKEVNKRGLFNPFRLESKQSMKLTSLIESKDTYFRTASEAADTAREMAEKKGYEIDEDDWQSQIAVGGKYNRLRPGVGKTNSFSVALLKNGKPQRKALNISLYGMESGNFELTAYIN